MRIVVCVKHVPDVQAERSLDPWTVRGEDDVLNELDEHAVEAAVQLAQATQGEVIAVTMGPAGAVDAVRRALQMGATSAVHISDEALAGSDAIATARVLAAAISQLATEAPVDLVITGMAALDGLSAMVPTALATHLGWPQLTLASELTVADGTATIRRDIGEAVERYAAPLPTVVSVTDQANEPRYPNFRAIMAARKRKVTTWSLADLNLEAQQSATTITRAAPRPPREAGRIVQDSGDGGRQLAQFLIDNKFYGA